MLILYYPSYTLNNEKLPIKITTYSLLSYRKNIEFKTGK